MRYWFRACVCVQDTHTYTRSTPSTLIECRCFGFSRLIVAVGVLKHLPTAVRVGADTSFSHLFFKLWIWSNNTNPFHASLHSSFFFCYCFLYSGRWCNSRVSLIKALLGGLQWLVLPKKTLNHGTDKDTRITMSWVTKRLLGWDNLHSKSHAFPGY